MISIEPRPTAADPHLLDPARLAEHSGVLYRRALSLCGSPPDAEDLVQDAYVSVLSKPRFVRAENDAAYLQGVLRNTWVNHLRNTSRRRTTAVAPEDLEALADGRGAREDHTVLAREARRAIDGLPRHHRDVLLAVDVLGLSYSEAAEVLRVPAGTVMSRLSRARREVCRVVGEPLPAAA
jgi:RNA polymerase sigma-70 factor, ECF subfamily